MVALASYPHRLTALILSAVALTSLIGFAASFGPEAPASPQPSPATLQLSPSGKIIDRLPNSAPATVHFADPLAGPERAELAALDMHAGLDSSIAGEFIIAKAPAIDDHPLIAKAKAQEARAQKPPRAAARPRRPPVAFAALPPMRPASLHEPQNVSEGATVKERHVSVAGRMIAFVGSLASLARVL